MKEPSFWKEKNIVSFLMYPLSLLYYFGYKIRTIINKKDAYKSAIPVICVGNLTVGGNGKTPTCVEIAKMLTKQGKKFCFLSKGYKGNFDGVLKIDNTNNKSEITGDEPLILYNYGDVFLSRSRVDGLKYINNNFDYDYIIMDDGLQNPTFKKDKVIVLVDGNFGFGNNFIIPAGPLREKLDNVYKNIDLLIIVGEDRHNIAELCKKYNVNYTFGSIKSLINNDMLHSEYIAFCGIGRPEKFKKTLDESNIKVKDFISFEDHYCYTNEDIEKLKAKYKIKLITTEKDWVKLSQQHKNEVECLRIFIDLDEEKLKQVL